MIFLSTLRFSLHSFAVLLKQCFSTTLFYSDFRTLLCVCENHTTSAIRPAQHTARGFSWGPRELCQLQKMLQKPDFV